jgi:predicted RecA/RadA family phage recombinase
MSQTPVVFVQEGASLDYTPDHDVTAGDVVIKGGHVTIAKHDIPANTPGSVAIEGIFAGPKINALMRDGDAVFWDADANPVGGVAGSGAFRQQTGYGPCGGWCVQNAAAGDELVYFKLSAYSGEPAWLMSSQIYDDTP